MQSFQAFDDVPRMIGFLQHGTFRFLDITVRHQATKRDQLAEHPKLQEAKLSH